MTITIAQRYKPFSHQPGSCCLIPGSGYVVEAYPVLVRIKDLMGNSVKQVPLDIEGPLKQFTLMQDLQRGCVTLFSELYSLHVLPTLEVIFKKNAPKPPLVSQEQLSLGSHKKQEWERIKQRLDFREIFPLWFRLGSLLSLPPRSNDNRGVFLLLKECQDACEGDRPEKIVPLFKKLFLVGFEQMLIPRATDNDYQGILRSTEEISVDSPLYLLSEGAHIIRSLFLKQSDANVSILPHLPPECFAGRMVNVAIPPYGKVDLEWSKKSIRRLHFQAQQSGEVLFDFRPSIKQYRVRQNRTERGKICINGESLVIKSGSYYLLDQFQK